MKEEISSFSNPYIKMVKSLKLKKNREQSGLFVIEGVSLVKEALLLGMDIEAVILQKGFSPPFELPKECRMIVVPAEIIASLSDSKSPQGIAAVAKMKISGNALLQGGLVLALENVQDPGNVGAMIRTADAAGASMVLLGKGCADPYNPKVIRGSMGSVFHLPIRRGDDLPGVIRSLKEKGYYILAGHLQGKETLPALPKNIVVVIGNEGSGISQELKDLTDHLYKIPIYGRAESLNASVASGIILYDVVRA